VDHRQRHRRAAGQETRKSPSVDELKAARAERDAAGPAEPPGEDRAPSRGRHRGRPKPAEDEPGAPPHYTPGVITKGVNRLYRRTGKIVRAMDRDIGIAIIEATKNTAAEGEPDDSVGAAWDEVCRTNPRIRAWVLKVIAGGAWGQLLMAHAPIFLAIVMKDGIRKHIPFVKLLEAAAEADEEATDAEKAEALTPGDLSQLMNLAQGLMGQMAKEAA